MIKTLNLEDCVTFEIAQKLKEKGYPLLRVIKQNGNPIVYDLPQNHPNWQNCNAYYIPTISQVLKWLREEKKLHIMIDIWKVDLNNTTYKWGYDIVNLTTTHVEGSDTQCANSFEEAALAGIDYVLNYLI